MDTYFGKNRFVGPETVVVRGSAVSTLTLPENSNRKITVECEHGQRSVRWCRRFNMCYTCAASKGVYNTSKHGRVISWGDKISKAKTGKTFNDKHKEALSKAQYKCSDDDWPGFYVKGEIQKIRDSQEYIKVRETVFNRDNFTCQNCSMTEEKHIDTVGKVLTIHHIDYNKYNCLPENLISLCDRCNVIANYNRDYWFAYFNYIMEQFICI